MRIKLELNFETKTMRMDIKHFRERHRGVYRKEINGVYIISASSPSVYEDMLFIWGTNEELDHTPTLVFMRDVVNMLLKLKG